MTNLTLILSPFGTKNAGLHQSDVSFTGVITPRSTNSLIVLLASFSYRRGTLLALRTFFGVPPGIRVMCIGLSVFMGSGLSLSLRTPGKSPMRMSLNYFMLLQLCIWSFGKSLVFISSPIRSLQLTSMSSVIAGDTSAWIL